MKKRAERNRTVVLSEDEQNKYLSKCILGDKVNNSNILNSTIIGDIFDVADKIPDKTIDLLIADPPYNLGKVFGDTKFKKMHVPDYEKFTRNWIEKIIHSLKDTASIYICCDWKTSLIIGRILEDYFIINNRITWQREKGRGSQKNWKNCMEDIWFASVSKNFTFNADAVKQRRKVLAPYRIDGKPKDWIETQNGNFRDTYPSNFWDDISIPYWSMRENTDHPTQKSEKLLAKLILASSNPGDVILDPFLGSGTTSVAAKKLGRRYIGVELEPKYCALAEKRLEDTEYGDRIQGYSDGVFWERNSLIEQKNILKFKR